MKVKTSTLLWAAWLMLVIGFVADNQRMRKEIEQLNNRVEYQEQVTQMVYEDLHKLAHKDDNCWLYEEDKEN